MASIKQAITTNFMKSFLAAPFKGGDRIYTDTETKGLELRVQGTRAAWVARYKGKLVTFGYAAAPKGEPRMLTSALFARNLNDHIRYLIDTDYGMIKSFLSIYYSHTDELGRADIRGCQAKVEEMAARARSEDVHDNAWTLREAMENFIEKRRRPDQRKPIKDTYAKELRETLNRKQFASVIDLPLTKLTPKMAEDIRDAFEREAGISPSKKAVTAIRTVMKYTYGQHRGQAGLDGMSPWWLMLTTDTVINARHRNPGLEGIGKTLALAEYYLDHSLPGRVGVQHGLRDNVFAAFLWIVLSVQRQSSGLQLRAADLKPYPGREGWFLAAWHEGVMKNGRRFVLPVPPHAYEVIKPSMDRGKHQDESAWAFPSERGKGKHVTRSATLSVLKRLSATDKQMKGRPNAVNLLALNDIKYWSPHDTRNVVTRVLDEAGIPGGASVILAHTIEDNDKTKRMTDAQYGEWLEQRIADVTRTSYGDIQHLDLKSKAMVVWTEAVLEAWQSARREGVLVAPGKRVVLDPATAAETAAVAA